MKRAAERVKSGARGLARVVRRVIFQSQFQNLTSNDHSAAPNNGYRCIHPRIHPPRMRREDSQVRALGPTRPCARDLCLSPLSTPFRDPPGCRVLVASLNQSEKAPRFKSYAILRYSSENSVGSWCSGDVQVRPFLLSTRSDLKLTFS